MTEKELKEKIIGLLDQNEPVSATQLQKRLGLRGAMRGRLYKHLNRLTKEGIVRRTEAGFVLQGRPAKAKRADKLIEAKVGTVHEKFAFVTEAATGEELFIPGRLLLGALPGDRVQLRERPGRGELREGEVVKILEPARYVFTGVFCRGEGSCWVRPDSGMKGEVIVAPNHTGGARDGDKVVALIHKRAQRHRDHRARVLAVTGPAQSARACAAALLRANDIRPGFSDEILEQAASIERAGIAGEELSGRLDLRGEEIFTIDSAHSKDLDDAVSLKKREDGGWLLGVHIADVSRYVAPGSPLDEEALERGTSIYYADQVIPMLPPSLSNGICSLNEGEDRLTLSALLELGEDGELQGFRFGKSVIRSRVKGVYEEINRLLCGEEPPELMKKYGALLPTLRQMDRLAGKLFQSRKARGAIDLSSVESEFLFDGHGEVADIRPRVQGRSEKLIEEFMLLANQAAAAFAEREGLPFVYRIHEYPPEKKVAALFELLGRLGIKTPPVTDRLRPGVLRDILESVRGQELEIVVNNQILRSMAKARYSEKNIGHYGLVLSQYAHFTSPIRRYPDLAVHRIISAALAREDKDRLQKRFGPFAGRAAELSSERELRASGLERSCDDCFKAQYMQRHIGEVFDGVISAVASYGFYVALESGVEGLVHISSLEDDTYEFDGAITLVGSFGGKRYRVGQRLRVMAVRADVSAGQVDFTVNLPPETV